jgi:hypothetical protein
MILNGGQRRIARPFSNAALGLNRHGDDALAGEFAIAHIPGRIPGRGADLIPSESSIS